MSVAVDTIARAARRAAPPLDIEAVRDDFPILRQRVHGRPLVYLDNAATTQKPRVVLEALRHFYEADCANVHRGVHLLAERATDAYAAARRTVQGFLNAADEREIVFVRGTTEGINLVAQTFGRARIGAGDEVVLTGMEHHSNIVPWQMVCAERGARLRVAPVSDDGALPLDALEQLLGRRTRLVAVVHVSNALGTVNAVGRIVEMAHAHGAAVLIDGAQAVPHLGIDVRALDSDFYVFSGHKLYAPMGIGVLYGKARWLEEMPPWQGGGDMINRVTFEKTTFKRPPAKFEAGTPHVAGAVGLAAAIGYVTGLGLGRIAAHEAELLAYGTAALLSVPGLRLIGTAPEKAAVLSFVLDGIHPHDIGTVLDREGVAIRAGHHCTQPLMDRFGVTGTARASLGLYSTRAEIDALVGGLHKARELLG
jgi:cysteine desulfurase/selenocysteine lyase